MKTKFKKLKIKKCNAKHGRYNLDNSNVIIEVDVELDTKEITKNIALKVEKLIETAPELLEMLEISYSNFKYLEEYANNFCKTNDKSDLIKKMKEVINKAKAEN